MLEHDVRMRVSAAAVKSDADITASLLAHCVWFGVAHEPDDLLAILDNDIAPATIFAGGPVTTLLFENSRLWTIVRTALIKLRRLPDEILSQIFALNTRLADTVIAHQSVPPVNVLPRFAISRAEAKIVRPPSNTAVINIPITAPPVFSSGVRRLTDDLGQDFDDGRAKRLCTPNAPEREHATHMVVRSTNGYHRTRKYEFGDNTANPEIPICHFRGCTREWSVTLLREHTSRPVYMLRDWQTFFCDEHLATMAHLVEHAGTSFCHCCGITAIDTTIPLRPKPSHPLAVPICDKCIVKEYVIRQLRMLCRRRRGRRARVHATKSARRKLSRDDDDDDCATDDDDSDYVPDLRA